MTANDRFSLLLYRTSFCGCLLGAAGTFYFIAGVNGYLGNPLLNIATAAVTVSAALFFFYVFFLEMADKGPLHSLFWFLILLLLLVEVVLGLAPPTARDEMTHHLVLPKLYVKAGRIFEIPFAPYSYYPMLLDMLYAPWIKWGWDSAPKLIHGLFAFLTGLLLYAHLARRLSPTYGLLGILVFISTPVILRLSSWAYVDLGLTFYSTSSLLCLLRWSEKIGDSRWLALAGLSAGFTLSTKPNGLLVVFLLFFLLAFILGREEEKNWNFKAGQVIVFAGLALIPIGPWLLKNAIQTGNPFFPFFPALFGGGEEGVADSGLGILAKRRLLYGESWWQIAALPLRVFFSGQDDRPQYFDGALSPILILFLPWVFRGKQTEENRLLFGFALFYFFYALFLTDLRIRYILPIVPPLAILFAWGVHNIYLRTAHPSYLFVGVALLLALNGSRLWNYFSSTSPTDYLSGRESREHYLSRMLPDYPAFRYVNQTLPSTAKIYLLFMGRRAYYCERDYFHDPGENPWLLLHMIQAAQNRGEIQARLAGRGITHLLIREELLERFLNNNLNSDQRQVWASFTRSRLGILFHSGGYSLYEIYG